MSGGIFCRRRYLRMATEEAPLAAVEEPIPPDLVPLLEGILPVHETSDMVLVVRIRRWEGRGSGDDGASRLLPRLCCGSWLVQYEGAVMIWWWCWCTHKQDYRGESDGGGPAGASTHGDVVP